MKRVIILFFLPVLIFSTSCRSDSGVLNLINFPLGHRMLVELEFPDLMYEEMTEQTQKDQVRDWLLTTILVHVELHEDDLNKILFDQPVARYDCNRNISNMAFGETRSRYVGLGEVVALVPKCGERQRQDYLAHIADEHRKNQGFILEKIHVFEYEMSLLTEAATIRRLDEFDAGYLYAGSSGYFERDIYKLEDLEAFMNLISDITYVAITGDGGLRLGGRKLLSRRYEGIGVEAIATLYQSQVLLEQKKNSFDNKWANKRANSEEEVQAMLMQRQKEIRDQQIVNGSGFSLDPTYNYEGIVSILNTYRRLFAGISPDFSSITRALWEKDVDPLFRALGIIKKSYPSREESVEELLHRISEEATFQRARYDGHLQGTEVGMNLFYTDLLAKLWTIDYRFSSPKGDISAFICDPEVEISRVFEEEMRTMNRVRLWFGPDESKVQIGSEGQDLYFARCATKIYSASSNTLKPGEEAPVSAFWGASTNWWNDHYEEVAEFEPAYERLNEQMKWSLIISWLSNENQIDLLSFLEAYPVQRTLWFPEWVNARSDLKFKGWDKISFYPKDFLGNSTEVLPALSSPFGLIRGGVSLGSKSHFKDWSRLDLNPKYSGLTNRGFHSIDPLGKVVSPKGRSFQFDMNKLSSKAPENYKLYNRSGEIPNQVIKREILKQPYKTTFKISQENVKMNELSIKKDQNHFSAKLESQQFDNAQFLAKQLSDCKDPIQFLEQSKLVKTSFHRSSTKSSSAQEYYIELNNAQNWIKIEVEQNANRFFSERVLPVSASSQPSSKFCRIKFMSKAEVQNIQNAKGIIKHRSRSQLSEEEWIRVDRLAVNREKIDQLIKEEAYEEAAQGLKYMSRHFGDTYPELHLKYAQCTSKMALKLLKNGQHIQGRQKLDKSVRQHKDQAYSKELREQINQMLRDNPLSKSETRVVQQFLDFHIGKDIKFISTVDVKAFKGKGKQLSLRELLREIDGKDARIMIEDRAFLNSNSFDWSNSPRNSLKRVMELVPDKIIVEKLNRKGKYDLRLQHTKGYEYTESSHLGLRLEQAGLLLAGVSAIRTLSKIEDLSRDSISMPEYGGEEPTIYIIYLPNEYIMEQMEERNQLLNELDSMFENYLLEE